MSKAPDSYMISVSCKYSRLKPNSYTQPNLRLCLISIPSEKVKKTSGFLSFLVDIEIENRNTNGLTLDPHQFWLKVCTTK